MNRFFKIGIVVGMALFFGIVATLWMEEENRFSRVDPANEGVSLSEDFPKQEVAVEKDETDEAPFPNFVAPLDRAGERVTKKPFGIFIDPKTSPVQPERFGGYHTGTDFEIFSEEREADVTVRSICDGKILTKRWASGYGGVLVVECDLESEEEMTVVYGHLALSSVSLSVGDRVGRGDTLGILGQGASRDTDGERKHLHLGVHRGSEVVVLLGYVDNKRDLDQWRDPCSLVCGK